MTWHPFIVLYLIQCVPLNYFIKVILRKKITYLYTYEFKIVLLQSHHESRRTKITADIYGSCMILDMEGQVKLIALWDAMFQQANVHLLLRHKFWSSKNKKNACRTDTQT